jgi:hypothetical protein
MKHSLIKKKWFENLSQSWKHQKVYSLYLFFDTFDMDETNLLLWSTFNLLRFFFKVHMTKNVLSSKILHIFSETYTLS